MADYNANIRVSADTKKAESEISKLQTRLNQISDFSLKLNSKDIGRQVNQIGQQLRGIGERGLLGGLTLAAGKSATALTTLGAKLGIVGAAAAAAGNTINSALGGVPAVVGEILGQVGQIPNAFGLAAVAAMAFAPQLTKAAASAVGLGAAVDKAVGTKATQGIASAVAGVTQLNTQLNATQASFAGLLSNDPLNKLVAQLRDAQKQVGEYQAFSEGSFEAVEQLLTVERLVTKEKRAQAALYNQLNSEARQLKAQVQQNVIASRNSRSGSGFNSFSSVASALEGSSAVDKAIRRNYEKRIRNAPAAPAAPLMLPSSEMLFSGNRRIQRLTADPGLQAASAYTRELGKAVAPAKQLDGIFTQVSKAMSATAEGAAEGNRITQSWLKALREMAQIKEDIAETAARELKLQQKAAAAETANKRKAFGRQAESLALGVGFPLLFGGGAGSVLGAAAGSFVGSGFGGQILGGAIGQIIDDFIKSTQDLGIALNEPTKAFDALKERSLLATKALEKLGDRLQDAGFVASASALAQRELAAAVGRDGAQNLRDLGDAADRSSRAFAEAVARFQGKVAGPLSRIQGFLATGGEISNAQARGFDVNQQLAKAGRSNTSEAKALQRLLLPGAGAGKTSEQFLVELRQAIEAAERQLPPLKVKLSPEQVRDELKNVLVKQLEALDTSRTLVQAVRERARAQEDLDQQRTDMVLQQERAIGDLRRSIEDRVTEIRLTNLQRENELLSVQADLRMQQLRNSNSGLRTRFGNDQAAGAANAVADYLESELQTANDAARIKRDAALEVKRIDIETERFKIQTALQISRLNQDTAKQVAGIQRGVLRQNQDYDGNRFKLEQSLAKLRLQGLAAEFALLAQQGQAAQRPDIAGNAAKALSFTQAGITEIDKLKGPSALKFNASGFGSVGASTSGIEAQSAQAKQLLGDITAAKQTLLDLVRAGNYNELRAKLDTGLTKPLTDAANEAQLLFIELSGQKLGTSSSGLAKANTELNDLISQLKQLKGSDQLKDKTGIQTLIQSYIDSLPGLEATSRALTTQRDILVELNDKQIALSDQLAAINTPYGELNQVQQVRNELLRQGVSLESAYSQQLISQAAAVDALQQQIQLATQLQGVWRGVGNAMGEAMTMGVSSVVNGTREAETIFIEFLSAIGNALLQTAASMISTYIAIGIARVFAGLSGGGGTASYSTGNVSTNAFNPSISTGGFGNSSSVSGAQFGPFLGGSFSAGGRANGGPVKAATPYLIGERGPELFVPGASGSVVSNRDLRSAMGGAPGSQQGPVLNMRFETTNIGGVEYVSREQLEAAMAATRRQAASDGARRGMTMTLDKLQQSPSTRRQIGI